MKRPLLRLLYALLFLILFTLTLTSRTFFSHSIFELDTFRSPSQPRSLPIPQFNATILKFAEVDISGPKFDREIEQLLEPDFLKRYIAFVSQRFNLRGIRARTVRPPVIIRTPRFYSNWPGFRTNLEDWSRNRNSFRSDILNDLVSQVKNKIEKLNGIEVSSSKYSSCAVVGNSGILLEKEYGELIDSHEVVIRLNNAVIGNFTKNVGSKTNISFVNSNILNQCARRLDCSCHRYGDRVPMVMYICQPIHVMDYTVCNSSHKSPILITDARFDTLCARIVKYYSVKRFLEESGKPLEEWPKVHDGSFFHYSSGFQAVMLALGACDRVSVFGFGKSESAKHHYHTRQKAELKLHDYEAEYEFYRDLVERPQAIPFVSNKFKFPPVVLYK